MKQKIWIIVIVVLVLAIVGGVIYWRMNIGNRQVMDTKFLFDRAILKLPDGEVVEGKVNSWLDFDNSDVVQVKIDGKTYLTSYVNVCLIDD